MEKGGYIGFDKNFLTSPAMTDLSINCWRLIQFLMIEHLGTGWRNGGILKAPYNQLERFGIPRRYINSAIKEAEDRGLILVDRGMRVGRKNYDNRYELTFATAHDKKHKSNEWKKFTELDLAEMKARKKKLRGQNDNMSVSESEKSMGQIVK